MRDLQPDIIVLDITLPMLSGVEIARRLRAAGCTARIVFLTVHADPDYASEAFDVGALGYVIKPRLASDLALASTQRSLASASPHRARNWLNST